MNRRLRRRLLAEPEQQPEPERSPPWLATRKGYRNDDGLYINSETWAQIKKRRSVNERYSTPPPDKGFVVETWNDVRVFVDSTVPNNQIVTVGDEAQAVAEAIVAELGPWKSDPVVR